MLRGRDICRIAGRELRAARRDVALIFQQFKKRKLDENNLVAGAAIVGGAKLVEFLSDGSPCVSY